MDHHLRGLLFIAVLVSINFSSSAQNTTPSDVDDSIDIHISNVCTPGTNLCDHPHINSVIAKPTEEAVTDEDSTKFKPLTICDPITKVCGGSHPGNFDVTGSHRSGEEDASQSDPSIICDPITHICREPKPNSLVSESDKDEQPEYGSVIHEEKEKISPLVCDPFTGNCQDPHHSFGVAQPRDEVA